MKSILYGVLFLLIILTSCNNFLVGAEHELTQISGQVSGGASPETMKKHASVVAAIKTRNPALKPLRLVVPELPEPVQYEEPLRVEGIVRRSKSNSSPPGQLKESASKLLRSVSSISLSGQDHGGKYIIQVGQESFEQEADGEFPKPFKAHDADDMQQAPTVVVQNATRTPYVKTLVLGAAAGAATFFALHYFLDRVSLLNALADLLPRLDKLLPPLQNLTGVVANLVPVATSTLGRVNDLAVQVSGLSLGQLQIQQAFNSSFVLSQKLLANRLDLLDQAVQLQSTQLSLQLQHVQFSQAHLESMYNSSFAVIENLISSKISVLEELVTLQNAGLLGKIQELKVGQGQLTQVFNSSLQVFQSILLAKLDSLSVLTTAQSAVMSAQLIDIKHAQGQLANLVNSSSTLTKNELTFLATKITDLKNSQDQLARTLNVTCKLLPSNWLGGGGLLG